LIIIHVQLNIGSYLNICIC